MQLKTSCFNKTVFRKNLTRFAPIWGVYTLCLILGILLVYSNGGTTKQFYFAYHMSSLVEIMAVVNLVYALLVAELLFGDLFNSRMCNMLHAFPLRRENWFVTNFVSGLMFSLVPTALMALVALPLLAGSLFEDAYVLSWWVFLASNLEFVCFFGIAAFSAMCVGNRFTMAAGYGLINGGAGIAYWLVETIYTPMLYGVITPTALMSNLTPFFHMTEVDYIQISDQLHELKEIFGDKLIGAVATFTITDNWWRMWALAGVGLAFALAGLLLYRIRNLECAGDAVAFPVLVPVFQVLCAICVAAGAQFFLYVFLGWREHDYLILGVGLAVGLAVGWFVGKMMQERTTRVFQLKNFVGLAALAAVFAVSLWLTHVDILRIETRLPDADKIKAVTFAGKEFDSQEDIDALLALHADALENRAEQWGTYVLVDGEWIRYEDTNADRIDEDNPNNRYAYTDSVNLTYEMDSGKIIRRRYCIWMDNENMNSEAGRIAKDFLTRWEMVNYNPVTINGVEYNRLDLVLKDVEKIRVDYVEDPKMAEELAKDVDSLIAAIQADCAEGTMAQGSLYHTGHFRINGYYTVDGIGICIRGEKYVWWVNVYPDSRHTLAWLRAHNALNAELRPENIRY